MLLPGEWKLTGDLLQPQWFNWSAARSAQYRIDEPGTLRDCDKEPRSKFDRTAGWCWYTVLDEMAGFSLHVAQVMNACTIPCCYSFLSGFALCPCHPELAMAGKMGPVDSDCCVLVPALQWGLHVSQPKQPQIDLDAED